MPDTPEVAGQRLAFDEIARQKRRMPSKAVVGDRRIDHPPRAPGGKQS